MPDSVSSVSKLGVANQRNSDILASKSQAMTRKAQAMQDLDAAEVHAHPLFPCDDDEEPADITFINVTRQEAHGKVWVPGIIRAEDLQSLETISERWGGGRYELIGRRGLTGQNISARVTYILPGASKAIVEDVSKAPAEVQTPVAQPAPSMFGMPSGDNGIMGLIMMMMQQMMQQSAASQTAQTQMMLAMMNGASDRSKETMMAMSASFEKQAERDREHSQQSMLMMKEAMQARGGGGSDETFFRGVEFMRTFSTQQIEAARAAAKENGDAGLEGLLGSVMQAIEGGMQLYNMSKAVTGEAPVMPSNVVPITGGVA